jgi:uncharacterized protein
MKKELEKKYSGLKQYLNNLGKVVIAYSGGVDSALLLKVAADELGEDAIALIGKSESMPEAEFKEAISIAKEIGIEPVVVKTNEIESPVYYSNPVERCYHCKKIIFGAFDDYMKHNKLIHLLDGSNHDDLKDYRPGTKALEYYKVTSPLKELEFTKNDIRELSQELGLSTSNKEAMACLSTRIAYNEPITKHKLQMIEEAENFLKGLHFNQVRARLQNETLRIEVSPDQVPRFFDGDIRQKVLKKMKSLGFKHISIDMEGYRMGSMNN